MQHSAFVYGQKSFIRFFCPDKHQTNTHQEYGVDYVQELNNLVGLTRVKADLTLCVICFAFKR